MAELTGDMLLGMAIQLIRDIRRISFLGDEVTCVKIKHMTEDWLARFDHLGSSAETEGGDTR